MVKRRGIRSRQVWIKEMSASEPSTKRRKEVDDTKTRVCTRLWDQYGRYLLTGHEVSGVKKA